MMRSSFEMVVLDSLLNEISTVNILKGGIFLTKGDVFNRDF